MSPVHISPGDAARGGWSEHVLLPGHSLRAMFPGKPENEEAAGFGGLCSVPSSATYWVKDFHKLIPVSLRSLVIQWDKQGMSTAEQQCGLTEIMAARSLSQHSGI